ncbi:MAG: hypothetical protein RQ966_12870 [Acetobacteraceae bacterium]|nr:hypothetical protein [Acetobacteraceae bacterium]
MADVEAQLLALDAERDRLRGALAELPARERALLAADAADELLAPLATAERRLRFQLDVLDARERELTERAARLQAAAREQAWIEWRGRYEIAAAAVLDAVLPLRERLGALNALVAAAALDGFRLPAPPATVLNDYGVRGVQDGLGGVRGQPTGPPAPPLSIVRFVRGHGLNRVGGPAYVRGDVAGFAPDEAARLVALGVAVWLAPPAGAPLP